MNQRPSCVTIVDDVAQRVSEDNVLPGHSIPMGNDDGRSAGRSTGSGVNADAAALSAGIGRESGGVRPTGCLQEPPVVLFEVHDDNADNSTAKAPTFAFAEKFVELDFYNRLHHDDMQAYGPTTKEEIRCYFVLGALMVVSLAGLVLFEPVKYWQGIQIDYMFWCRSFGLIFFMFLVQTICGYKVVRGELKVGYSRKLEHMLIHSMPVFAATAMPSYTVTDETERETIKDKMSVNDLLWMQWFIIVVLGMLIKPLRRGMTFLMLSHRSFDRPEDRPYTLSWILSQTLGVQIFVCWMFIWLLEKENKMALVFLPLIVSNIGDGLAEPVGIRFGKHKYKTRAIWYDGRFCFGSFTRSLEGSSAVFFTAALTVVAYYAFGYFTASQFVAAMLIMPIGFTLTEAYAPHTWDNPCLVAVGFFMTWVCLDVVS